MNLETISFEVSQDILDTLKVGSDELLQSMRLLTASDYFQENKLSLSKAAELAGMNRLAFMDILSKKNIVIFDYDESELNTELRGITQLRVNNGNYQ